MVLRYRISLEQKQYAPSTINLRLAAVRRVAYEAADSGLLSPELAAGIRRVKEFVDWGGQAHVGGGSHGSLHASDSLAALVVSGVEPPPSEPKEWAIRDVAGLVRAHFGTDAAG